MSKAPIMPINVATHLGDTGHLSEGEHGIYVRLLMCMWNFEGYLPDDDADLARICRIEKRRWVKRYRPVMEQFFDISDGRWTQEWIAKKWARILREAE